MTGPDQSAFRPTTVRRIDNLTGVRAYAALWVVVLHISALGFAGRFGKLINHGVIAVDVFFVLSGLVLSLVYAPGLPAAFSWSWYRRFIGRRFAKIYPLHLMTFCLAALIILPARHYGQYPLGDNDDTLWSAICNVLMLHGFGSRMAIAWNGVSWSVGAEWFAYTVLFAPIVFLLRAVRTRWIMITVAALWIGLFAFFVFFHVYDPNRMAGSRLLRITPEFFGGYALYRWMQSRPHSFRDRTGDLYTLGGIAGMGLLALGPMPVAVLLLPIILLLLRGAYAGGPWTDRVFGNRPAVLLGEASFSLYMTHMFVIVAGNYLQHIHPAHGWLQIAIVVPAELLLTLLLGFVSFRYVEEPLRRRLVRLFSAESSNPEALTPPTLPGLSRDTEVSATIS